MAAFIDTISGSSWGANYDVPPTHVWSFTGTSAQRTSSDGWLGPPYFVFCTAKTSANDQYSKATFVPPASGVSLVGVGVRLQRTPERGYFAGFWHAGGWAQLAIDVRDASGTRTLRVQDNITMPPGWVQRAPYTLEIRVVGGLVTVLLNDVEVAQVTDPTPYEGEGSPGFYCETGTYIDQYEADDIGEGEEPEEQEVSLPSIPAPAAPSGPASVGQSPVWTFRIYYDGVLLATIPTGDSRHLASYVDTTDWEPGEYEITVTAENSVLGIVESDPSTHKTINYGAQETPVELPSIAAPTSPAGPTVLRGAISRQLPGIAAPAAPVGPTVAAGSISRQLPSIASVEALGGVSVSSGGISRQLPGIGSQESLGGISVSPGPLSLPLPSIASAEALGGVSVSPGPISVQLPSIASEAALGGVYVGLDQVFAQLASIVSEESLGGLSVSFGPVSRNLPSISSQESVPGISTTVGGVEKSLSSIAAPAAPEGPSVIVWGSGVYLAPIPTAEALGPPSITYGEAPVYPASIPAPPMGAGILVSAGAIEVGLLGISPPSEPQGPAGVVHGATSKTLSGIPAPAVPTGPSLSFGEISRNLPSIASTARAGSVSVEIGGSSVLLGSIPSQSVAVGPVSVSYGPASIAVGSIPAPDTPAGPTTEAGPISLDLSGIASTAAVGALSIDTTTIHVSVGSAPSASAVGRPSVTHGDLAVVMEGIPVSEAVPGPSFVPGELLVSPRSIESEQAAGAPEILYTGFDLPGIASGVRLGGLSIQPGPITVSLDSAEFGGRMGGFSVTAMLSATLKHLVVLQADLVAEARPTKPGSAL
jgi:hypothetical protein